ncbi:MAG: SPOR domain-containing protein [Pseudomonadota bacterium]
MAKDSKSPLLYLAAGLVIGLFVAFLLFLSQQQGESINLKEDIAKAARDARTVREDSQGQSDHPSFDFYEMLPELEVSVGEDNDVRLKPKTGQPALPPVDEEQRAPSPEPAGNIFLQVGAFSKFESADRQKASLLLQNWPTKVQSVTRDDGGKIFRVFVGPYSKGEALDSAERQLKKMGLKPYRLTVDAG